jgi:hypothetical protein
MSDMPYTDILNYTHSTDYKIRALPLVGPWFSRVGHITNILATGGADNLQIWVEGFFYASPRLIWLVTKPFLQAEEWYRFLDKHCGKKGKGKIREFNRALGLQEELGSVPTPGLNGAVRTVFSVTIDVALKAEWYFFIADRVTEFAYNWTSLVYQWEHIQVTTEPHAQATFPPGYEYPAAGNIFNGWNWFSQFRMNGYWGGCLVPQGVGASAGYSITSLKSPFDGQTYGFTAGIIEQNSGKMSALTRSTWNANHTALSASDWLDYEGQATPVQNWGVICIPDEFPFYCEANFQLFGTNVGKKGLFFDP